jgi:hypothetical protein
VAILCAARPKCAAKLIEVGIYEWAAETIRAIDPIDRVHRSSPQCTLAMSAFHLLKETTAAINEGVDATAIALAPTELKSKLERVRAKLAAINLQLEQRLRLELHALHVPELKRRAIKACGDGAFGSSSGGVELDDKADDNEDEGRQKGVLIDLIVAVERESADQQQERQEPTDSETVGDLESQAGFLRKGISRRPAGPRRERAEAMLAATDQQLAETYTAEGNPTAAKVRKTPSWPRSWANCSLL